MKKVILNWVLGILGIVILLFLLSNEASKKEVLKKGFDLEKSNITIDSPIIVQNQEKSFSAYIKEEGMQLPEEQRIELLNNKTKDFVSVEGNKKEFQIKVNNWFEIIISIVEGSEYTTDEGRRVSISRNIISQATNINLYNLSKKETMNQKDVNFITKLTDKELINEEIDALVENIYYISSSYEENNQTEVHMLETLVEYTGYIPVNYLKDYSSKDCFNYLTGDYTIYIFDSKLNTYVDIRTKANKKIIVEGVKTENINGDGNLLVKFKTNIDLSKFSTERYGIYLYNFKVNFPIKFQKNNMLD